MQGKGHGVGWKQHVVREFRAKVRSVKYTQHPHMYEAAEINEPSQRTAERWAAVDGGQVSTDWPEPRVSGKQAGVRGGESAWTDLEDGDPNDQPREPRQRTHRRPDHHYSHHTTTPLACKQHPQHDQISRSFAAF
jgi:hypothetical protein